MQTVLSGEERKRARLSHASPRTNNFACWNNKDTQTKHNQHHQIGIIQRGIHLSHHRSNATIRAKEAEWYKRMTKWNIPSDKDISVIMYLSIGSRSSTIYNWVIVCVFGGQVQTRWDNITALGGKRPEFESEKGFSGQEGSFPLRSSVENGRGEEAKADECDNMGFHFAVANSSQRPNFWLSVSASIETDHELNRTNAQLTANAMQ